MLLHFKVRRNPVKRATQLATLVASSSKCAQWSQWGLFEGKMQSTMHLLSVLDCGMTPCEEKFQIQVWLGFGLVLHFWSFLYPLLCRSKILQSHLGSVALVCDRLRLARRNAPLAMWPKSMVMMTGYCIASRKSWHQQPFDVPGPTVPWVKIKSERERDDNKNCWTAGIRIFPLYGPISWTKS